MIGKNLIAAAGNGISTGEVAEAIDFDGTNDELSRASDLTGNADGKTFTFSCWLWRGEIGSNQRIYYSLDSQYGLYIQPDTSNNLIIYGYNAANTQILNATVTVPFQVGFTFMSILISIDMANTANRSVYINDVAATVTWTTYTNAAINFTCPTHKVGQGLKGRLSNVYLDYTYRDLSITANRRLFITADLKPADGQASLNPVIYLPLNGPTAPGANAGTGGNFTLTGTVARSGRGPNQYNAPYSDLDGTADYLSRTSISGIADSKQFAISFCANFDTFSTAFVFVCSATSYFRVYFASNTITVNALNAGGSTILSASYNIGSATNRNYCIQISCDMADTAKRHMIVNGQAVAATWSTYTNDTIDFTHTTYQVGRYSTNQYFNGRLGALWFNTSYIDLSVADNLAKFVTGTGVDAKPVDLGATGELPTGTSPLIYLPMYGNNAGKNCGTGGDFTVNSGPYTGARGPNEFWSGSGLFNNPTQAEGSSLTLNNSPDVTGITKTTFACCFKRRDVDVTDNSFIFNTTTSTNNNFHFSVYFTDTEVLRVGWNGHTVATSTAITDTNWHTLLVSVDSTATVARVYLDGVSLTATITLDRAYTQAFTYVGRGTGVSATQSFDGNIGFVYQAHEYIDISQEANRLKFFDAFGYPVNLAQQVEAAAIPAPYVYLLFGDPSNLGANNGAAGNFTNESVTASAYVKA